MEKRLKILAHLFEIIILGYFNKDFWVSDYFCTNHNNLSF